MAPGSSQPRLRWSRQAPQVTQEHWGDRCPLSTLRKAPALKGPKTLKCFQGSLIRQLIPIRKLPGAVTINGPLHP